MGLKTVHLIFIGTSILLSLGFGAWALNNYLAERQRIDLIFTISGFVLGAGLILYGIRFIKKTKHIGYL